MIGAMTGSQSLRTSRIVGSYTRWVSCVVLGCLGGRRRVFEPSWHVSSCRTLVSEARKAAARRVRVCASDHR